MGGRINLIDAKHAWGYHCLKDFSFASDKPEFRNLIYFHNGCNILSIFLSTIAGLVRFIGCAYGLYRVSKMDQTKIQIDLEAAKRFFKMELARSVLEFFCLGPLLATIVDGIVTLKHKKMLCFKEVR